MSKKIEMWWALQRFISSVFLFPFFCCFLWVFKVLALQGRLCKCTHANITLALKQRQVYSLPNRNGPNFILSNDCKNTWTGISGDKDCKRFTYIFTRTHASFIFYITTDTVRVSAKHSLLSFVLYLQWFCFKVNCTLLSKSSFSITLFFGDCKEK